MYEEVILIVNITVHFVHPLGGLFLLYLHVPTQRAVYVTSFGLSLIGIHPKKNVPLKHSDELNSTVHKMSLGQLYELLKGNNDTNKTVH
jgi:hypothetical protein